MVFWKDFDAGDSDARDFDAAPKTPGANLVLHGTVRNCVAGHCAAPVPCNKRRSAGPFPRAVHQPFTLFILAPAQLQLKRRSMQVDELNHSDRLEESGDEHDIIYDDGPDELPEQFDCAADDVHDEPESPIRDSTAEWEPGTPLLQQVSAGWIAHQKAKDGCGFAKYCRRLSTKHPMYAKGKLRLHAACLP